MYPFLSEDTLIRELIGQRDALVKLDSIFTDQAGATPTQFLSNKRFVVCGSVCRSEIRVLAKYADVIAIVDDYMCKTQSSIYGIPVIDSNQWVALVQGKTDVVSCILTPGARAYQHFTKISIQWGLSTLHPLQFLHLLEMCGVNRSGETGRFFWYGYEFFLAALKDLEKLIAVSNSFSDSYSKISWLCILLYRITLNPFYLEACAVGSGNDRFGLNSYSTNRQFFEFSDQEVYVDGGAFDGDTIEGFLRACAGKFDRIHSFEPSSHNNSLIRSRLAALQDEYLKPLARHIVLHEKGLWDSNTVLEFNPSQVVGEFDNGPIQRQSAHMVEGGIISHIYEKEHESTVSVKVPVTTVDEATNREATFIKLEIEGSELRALNGARETISRNKPKMAISIYHKPEDLVTLTDFVSETDKGYKLGFRQHNFLCPDGMVLYCS